MTAIYIGEHAGRSIFCSVDAIDYDWARQWKWRIKLDKRGKKIYAVRHGRRLDAEGVKRQCDIYMHKAILSERMGAIPPSPEHIIGEHIDGDSLTNRRGNLEWATRSHNAKTAKLKTPRCPERGVFVKPGPLIDTPAVPATTE